MCKHGDTVDVMVTIAADLSHSGVQGPCVMPIDRCIASIVQALQDAGIVMRHSCCGHGDSLGQIELDDGRRLVIQDWKARSNV